nr:transposase [Marinomonas primoryensis]
MKAYAYWLREYAEKFEVSIHAWVFMTNHVHLLCTPSNTFDISIIPISVLASYGKGVFNTGDIEAANRTAKNNVWI